MIMLIMKMTTRTTMMLLTSRINFGLVNMIMLITTTMMIMMLLTWQIALLVSGTLT